MHVDTAGYAPKFSILHNRGYMFITDNHFYMVG